MSAQPLQNFLEPSTSGADAQLRLPLMCAGSCNLAYTQAFAWTGPQCQLNKTLWGDNSTQTWGGLQLGKEQITALVRRHNCSSLLPMHAVVGDASYSVLCTSVSHVVCVVCR
jgi:hypothetical protein